MHHINADYVYTEKAWREKHGNFTSYTEKILEATQH